MSNDDQASDAIAIEDDAIVAKTRRAIDDVALRTILLEARSANGFLPGPLAHELIRRVVELAELGPTSANSLPVRYVFVESPEAKERLKPALSETNRDKTMQAPLTAIVAADLHFYERFALTFPNRAAMANRFRGPDQAPAARAFARDNALLQMGYFIVTARALGLDCGPMGGFDREVVDAAFFPEGRWISLYLINLGYSDGKHAYPRLPRLAFDDIAKFV